MFMILTMPMSFSEINFEITCVCFGGEIQHTIGEVFFLVPHQRFGLLVHMALFTSPGIWVKALLKSTFYNTGTKK